ncbi:hypothetical protein [Pseudomonas sp. NPDC086251]|uniref:hypothetical protein n=1 Tax=Pseudomonas sp. NPDC086251 TaxID=3364431 RepID=UPI003836AB16
MASNVQISGVPQVGQSLTGSYTYTDGQDDAEGASQLQWLRDGVAIAGANQTTYTPVVADEGHQVSFAVTPVAATGSEAVGIRVPSAAQSIAPQPGDAPVTVAPTGTSEIRVVGQTLNASYRYSDADGDLEGASTQQWTRNGVPIAGATSETYNLVDSDNHQPLQFSVTPVAQTGTPKSGAPATSAVLQVVGNTEGFLTPDTTLRIWTEADSFCRNQGQRLPTVAELQQLYLTATTAPAIGQSNGNAGNYDLYNVHGWPIAMVPFTWSSEQDVAVDMI